MIGNKIADRITKSQKLYYIIILKQLQTSMIKKHLTKDICLQKKDRKPLMIIHQITHLNLGQKNNWIGINDNSHGTCCTDSQINFKTAMLMSSLYDYSELNKYCMFYVHTSSFNITL